MFLEISQNSQENTCARASFLIKLQALPDTIWYCQLVDNTWIVWPKQFSPVIQVDWKYQCKNSYQCWFSVKSVNFLKQCSFWKEKLRKLGKGDLDLQFNKIKECLSIILSIIIYFIKKWKVTESWIWISKCYMQIE